MESKIDIFKLMTALFILLNVVILVSGYVIMTDVFKTQDALAHEKDFYLKKEEDVMQKIDIIKQSNVDLYSNIKVVTDQTAELKNEVLIYSQSTQSSQDEESFFQGKLSTALQQNNALRQDIASVQTQLQKQQAAAVAKPTPAPTVKKTVVKRTTRAS